jgi:phosphatidylserine decarboxylase
MSDLSDALKRVIVPVNKEGYFIISVSVAVSFLLCLISNFLGVFGLILTLFIIYFFRDPERVSPDDSNVILASADGVVDAIETVFAPKELNLDANKKFQRISIFLNTFNVHVQRIPIDGTIEKTVYVQGKFLNITNNKYHEDNERQIYLMKSDLGFDIVFVQIAGMIARRIVCNIKEEQKVKAGERFGCIKFGSRVDVYLPTNVEIKTKIGQSMIAGETVIGIV